MNDNISSSNSNKKLLLSKSVLTLLRRGMREGYEDSHLDLSNKSIRDSMIPELCDWFVKLEDRIKKLNLGNNIITSQGASMLFDALRTNKSSIKHIDLAKNQDIDDGCIKWIGEYIADNTNIEHLSLAMTSISNAGIKILVSCIEGNTTLKELDLSGNKGITDKILPLLLKMFETTHIEDINVDGTSITQMDTFLIPTISNKIKYGSRSLCLPRRNVNDDHIQMICKLMRKYTVKNLREINFGYTMITSEGASYLFDILRECNSVVSKLNLEKNRLDDECAEWLGDYILNNKSIERVNMNNTQLSDYGIGMLVPYLEGNTTCKELDLGGNREIKNESIPHLLKLLKSTHIEDINVDDTSIIEMDTLVILLASNKIKYGSSSLHFPRRNINDDTLMQICDKMRENRIHNLKEINITSKGASILFDTLKECNSVISKLDLSNNLIDDECMKQLGEYLQDNEYLIELNTEGSNITDKGIEDLSEYLFGNARLKCLYLGFNFKITNASVPYFVEIAMKTCIEIITMNATLISEEKANEIEAALCIPIIKREIPVRSNSKSAAKTSFAST